MTPHELDLEPKRIKRADPVTKGDYQKIMASVTKRDIQVICILTSHWPLQWFYDMHGDIKWERDSLKHALIVNSWIKRCKLNSKTKEI